MDMGIEELKYFDGKFKEVFDRISDVESRLRSKIEGVEETVTCHQEQNGLRMSNHKTELIRMVTEESRERARGDEEYLRKFETHVATRCPDVVKHEEECQAVRRRQWAIFSMIATLVLGAVELIRNFLKH